MASRPRQSADSRRAIEYLTAENERLRAQNEALRVQFRNIENDIWRGFWPDLRMKPAERLASDGSPLPPSPGKQFRDLPPEIRNMIWKLAAGPRLKTIFEIKERDRFHPSRWPYRQSQEPVKYGMFVSDPVFRRRVKVSQVCTEARSLLAPIPLESTDLKATRPGDPIPPGKGGNYNFAIWIWFDPALDSLKLPDVGSYTEELEVCRLIHGPVPRVLLPRCFDWRCDGSRPDVLIRPFFNLDGCESIGFIGRSVFLPPETQVPELLAARLGGGVPLAIDVDDDVANAALLDIFAQYPPARSWKLTRRTYRDDASWGFEQFHRHFGPRNPLVYKPPLWQIWCQKGFTEMLLCNVASRLWRSQGNLRRGAEFPGLQDPWCQEHKLLRDFPVIKPIIMLVEHNPLS